MEIEKGNLQEEEEASGVTRFYNIILSWDYKQLTKENERNNRKNPKETLNVVKNTCKDVDDYFETFEPLLLEKVKAQILQNQDREEVLNSKMRLVMHCSESEGFHFLAVTYQLDEDEYLAQNDLLLLSKEEVNGYSFPSSYGFAVVENRQNNHLLLRMHLDEDLTQITGNTQSSRTKSFIKALSSMRSHITSSACPIDKRVFSLKLCGLSTIIREYIALRSVSSLPFKDLIITAAEKSCGFGDEVVGSADTLKSYPLWENLIESAEQRNRFFQVDKPLNNFFSEEKLETMKVTEHLEIPDAPLMNTKYLPVAPDGGDDDFADGDADQDHAPMAEDD